MVFVGRLRPPVNRNGNTGGSWETGALRSIGIMVSKHMVWLKEISWNESMHPRNLLRQYAVSNDIQEHLLREGFVGATDVLLQPLFDFDIQSNSCNSCWGLRARLSPIRGALSSTIAWWFFIFQQWPWLLYVCVTEFSEGFWRLFPPEMWCYPPAHFKTKIAPMPLDFVSLFEKEDSNCYSDHQYGSAHEVR